MHDQGTGNIVKQLGKKKRKFSTKTHNGKKKTLIDDEINFVYKIDDKKDYIKLFREHFVKQNKGKFKMIINKSEYDLSTIISLKDYGIKKDDKSFELILKGKFNNIDLNEIFLDCTSLISKKYNYKSNPPKHKYKTNKRNNANQINLIIKIDEADINKKIFFLDNNDYSYYINTTKITHFHDQLQELNEKNTKLFIDNQKIKFKKYFVPEKCGIHQIKIIFDFKITNCAYMFSKCKNILNIDFSLFNTEDVTNMESMFSYCENLTNIDLSNFKTNNLSNMKNMFYGCKNISNIDLSNFNTENVTNMEWLFANCSNLTVIDLSSFNTQKLKYMQCMFFNCNNLIKVDLSSFNIVNVIDNKLLVEFSEKLDIIKINRKSYNKIKNRNGSTSNLPIFIIEI